MSFGEPILLFGLVLIPLAALAYGAMQGRKRREASAFANPALLPNLVTARPGLRRHLPPLLLMLALAVMVVALARPQRTVAAPERAATVMMVTDISGSMNATDVEPNRLSAAVKSAKRLTDELKTELKAAIRSQASPRHVPDEIIAVPGVPHTRTGKRLEVPLKRLFQGVDPGKAVNPGAVDDASLVDHYIALAKERTSS